MIPAIRVESLGKRYRIGESQARGSLRERLAHLLDAPRRLFVASNGKGKREHAEIWALCDINFEVLPGEVVGLIGRNGAGKSTLLKILSRVTQPTTGWAEVRGRMGSLLEVGTGFHPELTGRENVFLNGAILGMSKREIARKFDEIVAFAEVQQFIDTPVKHYSSGMYVRLAFAVAAHLETEILFVDEVLAVGDFAFQKKCLGKMGEVSRQGRTVVFVSHNSIAVRTLCSRSIWLDRGRVKEVGEVGSVVAHYLHEAMASNSESVWGEARTAPGDHQVRLKSVRVIPGDGTGTSQITVHTPVKFEFIYWNYVPDAVLNLSIVLHSLDQGCVLTTVSEFVPRPAALIRHVVSIPGDFLNTGSYYLDVHVVKDASVAILRVENVVGFEVSEGEVAGNWYGRTPGAVRPKLKWTSETLERDGA